jgi:uncharacterized repeat protein (TIGR02543 family)
MNALQQPQSRLEGLIKLIKMNFDSSWQFLSAENVPMAVGTAEFDAAQLAFGVDATAPVITVTSGTDTVEQGSTWTDAGATADGGEAVSVSGIVDTNTPGIYLVTYTATDTLGNTGTATRTVTVIELVILNVNATNGSVDYAANYQKGATATITATADSGYTFTGWSGDATGADNPFNLLMDGDKTITAIFIEDSNDQVSKLLQLFNVTREPFGFSFNTTVGRSYTVEATGDLRRWEAVELFQGSGGEIRFTAEPATSGKPQFFRVFIGYPEYHNGNIQALTGAGSDFFKKELTVNGVRIVIAGDVGGQAAVPDEYAKKVARMFELFTDPSGSNINITAQRNFIKTLRGDSGTVHAGFPTLQRLARGAGTDYSTNFLDDAGIAFWNLSPLFDSHMANDMVWYLNSTGDGYGIGEIDAQEVIEHVFHTLHMHGLDSTALKMYPEYSVDWQSGELFAAMEEAYDSSNWNSEGYGGSVWKTNPDLFEVAAKEYLYLLNFGMFEYTGLWQDDSLAPEWNDNMRTMAGIYTNNPLGYALYNTYIAPVISRPTIATINGIFGDGNTPAQDNPALAGVSNYFPTP